MYLVHMLGSHKECIWIEDADCGCRLLASSLLDGDGELYGSWIESGDTIVMTKKELRAAAENMIDRWLGFD